ncbi:MAG TPA: permease prefix domain 1-containing protein [Candidatus Saccharimonadales bacterium]|nr:permease prefix domain 1-containing protein [Candidatus Saccharimonadales bacterium]
MFNLESAILEWRLKMNAGGLKTAEVLDELESHLRDDVEAQLRSGRAEAEAFQLATQRMGQPGLLGSEFNKVEGPAIRRVKNAFLTLAGIPNQYLSNDMKLPSSNLEPSWATYLKASGFLAPALILWTLAALFVIPKLQQICQQAGLPDHAGFGTLWNVTHVNILLVNAFRAHGFMMLAGLITVLVVLEWRMQNWPRYRRAIVGVGTWVVNSLVLFSIFMMILTAVAVAPALLHHQ